MDAPISQPVVVPAIQRRPNIENTAHLFDGPLGIRSLSLTGLFILACFYTLYFARDFFLPVLIAIVFNFLLAPLVRALKKSKIPRPLGSAIVIGVMLGLLGLLLFELSEPLEEWLVRIPEVGAKLQTKAEPLRKIFERVSSASEQLERVTSPQSAGHGAPQQLVTTGPSLLGTVFSGTSKIIFTLLVVIVLLFFLLASGDLFLTKLVHVLPTLSDKKKAVKIAHEIESNISKYLATISVINGVIGILSAGIFWAFGLPNPAFWGAIAGFLNFIPTVGSLSVTVLIFLVSLATFPSITHAALVPAAFLSLTVGIGTFVSPQIMGRSLTLNPVVIFLGLSFWGWLWGIPGALLAVPLLAMFKIFCDHIEPLSPIGEFLGR